MPVRNPRHTRLAWLALAAALLAAPAAWAAEAPPYPQARAFFPGADEFGAFTGEPPAAEVRRGGVLVGYLLRTADVVRIPAYSGKPINNLVGIDMRGRITGAAVIEHQEPILVIGIGEGELAAFVAQYVGKSVFDRLKIGARSRAGYIGIDGISGATITTMVENATITKAARAVAQARGLGAGGGTPAGTDAQSEPLWLTVWRDRVFQIVVLGIGLFLLTSILVFQDWLARHPTFLTYVRQGFLVYTVVFIGWYAYGQLSIINVLTFISSFIHDFRWDNFLIDPMLFILWGFVAMALLLWGRGVYCGWLCPYGAAQELVNLLARRLRLRQFEFPEMVHERLWAVKYLVLLALFGLSLQSLPLAERAAEVEPFKTAFTLRFDRAWPFVLYAGGLLLVSAFNRKFFCRYLCPLGAALTFPARFRIFDWLRRRKECGSPCQICAVQCEVRAIRPTGEINANECHYCLDCQVTYWNDQKCPPLAERRRRREKSARALARLRESELVPGPAAGDGPGAGR